MKLDDFSTDALKFISELTHEDILIEIGKRERDVIRKSSQINIDDCFIEKVCDSLYTVYKITDVSDEDITYNTCIINDDQIEVYEDDIIIRGSSFFHEFESFNPEKYNSIYQKIEEYNKELESLHQNLFRSCIDIIND